MDPCRPGAAPRGPFGTTIAHGFLTLSLLPELAESALKIDDVRMGVNYGLNRVRFPGAGAARQPLRGALEAARATSRIDGGAQLT